MVRSTVYFRSHKLGLTFALAAFLLCSCSSESVTLGTQNTTLEDPSDSYAVGGAHSDPSISHVNASIDGNSTGVANHGPAGRSHVSIDNRRYALDSALGDIWGQRGSHYNVNFTVINGDFTITPSEIDGNVHSMLVPANASAVIYAEMNYPGDGFNLAKFEFQAVDGSQITMTDMPYFTNAYVGIDINGNGYVDAFEKSQIIGGEISFDGSISDLELNFSVYLDNGQVAVGQYTGLFDFTQRY
ncbi:MAG: hypothetical protein KTR32_24910 [Granulosicoccus sp.]|nr:hypothetical protein [Granulosicoccus sp.]